MFGEYTVRVKRSHGYTVMNTLVSRVNMCLSDRGRVIIHVNDTDGARLSDIVSKDADRAEKYLQSVMNELWMPSEVIINIS